LLIAVILLPYAAVLLVAATKAVSSQSVAANSSVTVTAYREQRVCYPSYWLDRRLDPTSKNGVSEQLKRLRKSTDTLFSHYHPRRSVCRLSKSRLWDEVNAVRQLDPVGAIIQVRCPVGNSVLRSVSK
jgi:hypothetical protein